MASCLVFLVLMLWSCGVIVGTLGAGLIALSGDVRLGAVLLTERKLSKLWISFQAALSAMYLPLSAVDVFMSILNTLANLFGLLARERDGGVVCRHVLVHVVLEADRVLI